jgi:hypothetical protein
VVSSFDPSEFALPQDFGNLAGVKKVLTQVKVGKPNRLEFVRVHPDKGFRLTTYVIEIRPGEVYLIKPNLWGALQGESALSLRALFTATNRLGEVFIWPVKIGGPDAEPNTWNESALEAATIAQREWVRVQSNMDAGMYTASIAPGKFPEPNWGDHTFGGLLDVAFKGRIIDTLEHPVLKRLRGEI